MSLKEILKNAQGVPTGEYKDIAGGTMYADSPIGSILPYGGTTAPSGWMICNGASLLRTDYAELFAVIGTAFGSADSTHFNIPDLRGEFLRGAGTNSHSGQGNGGSVGQHQDGTPIVASYMGNSGGSIYNMAGGYSSNMSAKSDKWTGNSSTTYLHHPSATEAATYSDIIGKGITRPTNTSVNYIIKAKMVALPADLDSAVDAKIAAKGVYSTSEVDTGKTWIDGKKIYRKTIVADLTVPSDGEAFTTMGSIPSTFETIIGATGFCKQGTANWVPFPRTSISGENQQSLFYFVRTAAQDRGSITLVVKSTDCAGSAKFILTLEYTKTI